MRWIQLRNQFEQIDLFSIVTLRRIQSSIRLGLFNVRVHFLKKRTSDAKTGMQYNNNTSNAPSWIHNGLHQIDSSKYDVAKSKNPFLRLYSLALDV